ncbi:hypothetical protein AMR76_14545 [Vibrio furnissii]|uniref:Uncharacterized protein n=1 Tax=Vibrio furnissii TaxID=29494 RepID=A0A0Q2UXF8_VIBFU|nr:hypothetical protein AMR76_14545 [Vibrio furnissii]TRN21080.1 hypothetical protein DM784_19260 [Vibrio furnissii]
MAHVSFLQDVMFARINLPLAARSSLLRRLQNFLLCLAGKGGGNMWNQRCDMGEVGARILPKISLMLNSRQTFLIKVNHNDG